MVKTYSASGGVRPSMSDARWGGHCRRATNKGRRWPTRFWSREEGGAVGHFGRQWW